MGGIVEIRTYTLKPGSGAGFHRTFVEDALPMLERLGGRRRRVRSLTR